MNMKYYYYENGKKITVEPKPVGELKKGTVVHDLTSRSLYQISDIYNNQSGQKIVLLNKIEGGIRFCTLSFLEEEISLGRIVIR